MKPVRVGSIFASLYVAGGDENRFVQHMSARDATVADHRLAVVLRPEPEIEAAPSSLRRRLAAFGLTPHELGEAPFRLRGRSSRLAQAADFAWTTARTVHALAAWIRRERVEVVDAHLSVGSLLALAAARLAGGIPVVSTTYGPMHFDRPRFRALGHGLYRGADTLVSDSRERLEDVERFVGRPLRCVVVPNGIEPPQATRSRAEVRAQLGVPQDAVVVGQVARFVDYKGQDRLVDAAAELLKDAPDTHFVLCGLVESADWRDRVRQQAEALGLAHRVHVTTWPGLIGDIWQAIDVHCHPTRLDSSPIAILEAMSLGLPSVTTDVGGIHALVEDHRSGRLLPADTSPRAIAAAVLPYVRSASLRLEQGERARVRWAARHAPRMLAAGMEAVYAEVAERHRARRGQRPA